MTRQIKTSPSIVHHPGPGVWFALAVIVAAACWIFCCAKKSDAAEKYHPFYPGERLTFTLKWGFIPAGEAVLEVLPMETIDGKMAYHFVVSAKSNPFVDIFYKVRDRVDAYADQTLTHSVLYKKDQHEGRTRRKVIVTFDWKKMEAQYANFNEKRDPISILSGSFDPLSAFYYTRSCHLKENTTIERPITDGKKSVIGKAAVVKREKIKLASGTYDTFLLEPELKHVGGVFEKSKNAKIKLWVTADDRKIPVKIKSKVVVGSFIGELTSATGVSEQ
jgi:hypothetical protein